MQNNQILVIEDDVSIRETLVEILESQDYTVIPACNGKEGLQKLTSNLNIKLVLLDLMMPVMDGLTFRKFQLENSDLSDIPVIILSADAKTREKMSHDSKNKGVVLLPKPIDLDKLINSVETLLKTS